MWRIIGALRARHHERRGEALEASFFERFQGRSLLVHDGLPSGWLDELLKTGGGGRHLRIDARTLETSDAAPVAWLVREVVLPLALPLPQILLVEPGTVRIRHLRHGGHVRHPADIPWILDDIRERGRAHAIVAYDGNRLKGELRLPAADNDVETPYGVL